LHPDTIDLATSKQGALTIAVRATSESILSDSITLRLLQRVGKDIQFTQYTFKPQSVTSAITGKDVNGKNLRFDTAAINEDRVQVRVDGIPRPDATLTPNTATFNAPIFP